MEFFGGSGKGDGDDPEAHVAALTAVLEDGKALGKVPHVARVYAVTKSRPPAQVLCLCLLVP